MCWMELHSICSSSWIISHSFEVTSWNLISLIVFLAAEVFEEENNIAKTMFKAVYTLKQNDADNKLKMSNQKL